MAQTKQCMTMMLLALVPMMAAASEAPRSDYPIKQVPFTDVRPSDCFWTPRIETNRAVTIPHAFKKCEQTGRISNFAVAAGTQQGKHQGYYFNDSDVYKIIEGAAYSLKNHPDPQLETYVDGVIDTIGAAQWEDGYLFTYYSIPSKQPEKRWTNMGMHELYCAGHMYEGAVAYYQATGKRKFLDIAERNADYICDTFGPDKKRDVCGHQEIEIGLVKLYRLTGKEKYLATAKFFLDERGHAHGRRLGGQYNQDHIPVIEQSEAVGHAVRAAYMYSAMADVAALTGAADYRSALERIWQNVVGRKMYITGGIGSRGGGEGFGQDYELPNTVAYCETCAAIANAMWNHRMFLLSGDAKYMDVVERVIYNGFLSGVSLDGDKFFYPNPLEVHSGRARSAWFDCACCPSNIVRFIPSIPGYAYAYKEGPRSAGSQNGIYVNLFIEGEAKISSANGPMRIKQETRYPWDGKVKIIVEPTEPGEPFSIWVRIPGWARNMPVPSDLYSYIDKISEEPVLKVNGRQEPLVLNNGFAQINRKWQAGDTIELDLPMPVRRVVAISKVADNRGRVALQRGPIVFCGEHADNKDGEVLNLYIPDDAPLHAEYQQDLLKGVATIAAQAIATKRQLDGTIVPTEGWDFVAVPYYAWAHRGAGPMTVWMAREPARTKPSPAPTLAHTSKITVSAGGAVSALTDQLEPSSSIDHSNPFFHWWPRKGTTEWIQLDFKNTEKISQVTVYWFDDTGIGECRLPKSWRLLYREGRTSTSPALSLSNGSVEPQWKAVDPLTADQPFGVEKDKFNEVTFEPVSTDAVRFEIQLAENFSAGIHELSIK